MRVESELEKLIREVKEMEAEEMKEEKEKWGRKKMRDPVSEHYDFTTLKVKCRNKEEHISQDLLREIFKQYGIIDSILLQEPRTGFVTFRYRDSAVKASQADHQDLA